MTSLPNPVFSEDYDHIRAVLISARKAAGLSQEALALRVGKAKTFVTMFENGQRRLDILDFHNLVAALERDPLAVALQVFEGLRKVEPPTEGPLPTMDQVRRPAEGPDGDA